MATRETLIKSASGMQGKTHGAQKVIHIKSIGEPSSTAQRSYAPAQSFKRCFPGRYPLILLWICLLFAVPTWAATGAEAEVDTEHPPLCEVNLQDEKAQFFFPILDIDEWRWFRKESQNEALEYAWEVMIPAEKPEFIFGIYLPKPLKASQQEGSLQQILDIASWNAIRLAPDAQGGLVSQPLPNIKLSAELDDGGVVLTLLDKASVGQILQGKPKTTLFNLLHPDEVFTTSCTADIQYPQPGSAKNSTQGKRGGSGRSFGKNNSSWLVPLP